MSYILDALKKSEKERTQKRTPSVGSLGDNAPSGSLLSVKSIITLVLAIAIANSAAIYLFFPAPQKEALPQTKDMTRPSDPTVRVESIHSTSENREILLEDKLSGHSAKVEKKARTPEAPKLDVTAHIYADEPDLRMVKINGVDRHEGDYLDSNHQLVKITELGIILEYYGRQYNMNIVEEWQLD